MLLVHVERVGIDTYKPSYGVTVPKSKFRRLRPLDPTRRRNQLCRGSNRRGMHDADQSGQRSKFLQAIVFDNNDFKAYSVKLTALVIEAAFSIYMVAIHGPEAMPNVDNARCRTIWGIIACKNING